jgi:hypothetical protein
MILPLFVFIGGKMAAYTINIDNEALERIAE